MDRIPHIVIVHQDHVPDAVFQDFRDAVAADGLDFEMEAVPRPGPFAGLEWVLPTAAMLFVAQGYFNGFLGEMGKDHYQALKAGLQALAKRFAAMKVTLIRTPGKVAQNQPYSLVFSILFAADDGRLFKFLMPIEVEDADRDRAIEAFLAFACSYATDAFPPTEKAVFTTARGVGGMVLLAFNSDAGRIQVMNPITRAFEPPTV
ncbi:hypothetical protein GCM10009093_27330 [Brevundimonas terrae]|uniref:VOC family protein n=1 Tax=Brevundimonas terrae TaxID=363631 RepID=A0ABN0YL58_9CAUL|nr:hypothetical protein [Brevundimonas terrae]NIJ27301.1 hypothetical protein [Brevundimonas terrae]